MGDANWSGNHSVRATLVSAKPSMMMHLGDLSSAADYVVRIEFTAPLEPALLAEGMPFVSLLTEIDANSRSATGLRLRDQYGRIPYGSPLYWWETHSSGGVVTCEYIGKTVRLRLQDRLESHSAVVRLLAKHVNSPRTEVKFRVCSRLDIVHGHRRFAVEHLPPEQAARVVGDVEAYLIQTHQPRLNTQLKNRPKRPWKDFAVEECLLL